MYNKCIDDHVDISKQCAICTGFSAQSSYKPQKQALPPTTHNHHHNQPLTSWTGCGLIMVPKQLIDQIVHHPPAPNQRPVEAGGQQHVADVPHRLLGPGVAAGGALGCQLEGVDDAAHQRGAGADAPGGAAPVLAEELFVCCDCGWFGLVGVGGRGEVSRGW